MPEVRGTRAVAILIGAATLLSPLAAAGHGGGPITRHETYELAGHGAGLVWECPSRDLSSGALSCDPTGQTQDGSIDLGGAVFELPTDHGASTVSVRVVDDHASTVAFTVCQDVDGDGRCCETDCPDIDRTYCNESPPLELAPRGALVVFVHGAVRTTLECGPAIGGTTGGLTTPAGGIYATFQGP